MLIAVVTFSIAFVILYIFPGLNDKKCYDQNFDWFTCFSDSINYRINERFGQCYIKNYHVKGAANETINLELDIYVAESSQNRINFSDDEIRVIINTVNKTWNEYGISFEINNISRFILDDSFFYDSPENLKKLSMAVVKENLFNDKNVGMILVPNLKSRLFFIFDIDSEFEGIQLNTSLFLVGTNGKNISWAITHELGHILGSYDYPYYSGQFNLMTYTGCIKDRFYPTILKQEQVDSAIRNAKTFTKAS